MSKEELKERYKLSDASFHRYVKVANKLKFDISTDFMEKELMLFYYSADDRKEKLKIIEQMFRIWNVKHKVPNSSDKEEKLDLTKLVKMGDPTE